MQLIRQLINHIKKEKEKSILAVIPSVAHAGSAECRGDILVELVEEKVCIRYSTQKDSNYYILFERNHIPSMIKQLFALACKTSGEPISGC